MSFVLVSFFVTAGFYRKKKENIGLHMKSKQLPLIEKCIFLTILSANSDYKFSAEMYLTYGLHFTTNK